MRSDASSILSGGVDGCVSVRSFGDTLSGVLLDRQLMAVIVQYFNMFVALQAIGPIDFFC